MLKQSQNLTNMKKALISGILGMLVLCGCDRTIWDTSRGNMSVSFRVDGTRYVCAVKNELVESPLRVAFYDSRFLDFHVDGFDRKTGEDRGCLTFTVSDIKPIVTGKRYNLKYYSGVAEDRVSEPPVFFAEFNGYRSTNGWVKLRSIKPYKDKEGYKIISGNFEFEAKNADGRTITITNGTFDGIY